MYFIYRYERYLNTNLQKGSGTVPDPFIYGFKTTAKHQIHPPNRNKNPLDIWFKRLEKFQQSLCISFEK